MTTIDNLEKHQWFEITPGLAGMLAPGGMLLKLKEKGAKDSWITVSVVFVPCAENEARDWMQPLKARGKYEA